jgi:hypothetical protein
VRLDAHSDFLGFESWHLGTKDQLLIGFLYLDRNRAKQFRLGTQPIIDIMTVRMAPSFKRGHRHAAKSFRKSPSCDP